MGNQGTAANGLRRAVEMVQYGRIGRREGGPRLDEPADLAAGPGRSTEAGPKSRPVPDDVHWDEWIGPAPMRPYAEAARYHPFDWRGSWDFGTGALGDMACHTANMAFLALKLGSPDEVSGRGRRRQPETCPLGARHVEFPARDELPPVTLHWYEGKKDGKKCSRPRIACREARRSRRVNSSDSGSILVGDKGIAVSPDDYGADVFFSTGEEDRRWHQAGDVPVNNGRRPGPEVRMGGGDPPTSRRWRCRTSTTPAC